MSEGEGKRFDWPSAIGWAIGSVLFGFVLFAPIAAISWGWDTQESVKRWTQIAWLVGPLFGYLGGRGKLGD